MAIEDGKIVGARRRWAGLLLVATVTLAVAACGGDDGGEQSAGERASSSDTTEQASDETADGDDTGATTSGEPSGCQEEDGESGDSGGDGDEPTGPGDIDLGDISVDEDGVSVESGDGQVSVDDDGVSVESGEGQVSVDEGGVSIEGCLGDIDVDASDGDITISGPDGDVTISVDEAVTELGGEDTDAGISVPLPEAVLFDFDSAVLRPDAAEELGLVAGLAAAYPDATIEIGGHTDAVGDEAYNQRLSEQRATAVRDALSVLGVPGDRMTATGHGESQPVAPNTAPGGADDPDGRQRNRRVEILLVGADL